MEVSSEKKLWEAVLGSLQVQLTRPNYDTFLKETWAASLSNDVLLVKTPNSFVAEYLERRLSKVVCETACRVAGRPIDVRFGVELESDEVVPEIQQPKSQQNLKSGHASFNDYQSNRTLSSRYTFATFVVGPSNELAYAAAISAAKKPGDKFNPIFLHSKVGLGKTHLLHAIGQHVRQSGLNLVYVSSDQFTSEFIRGIREGKSNEFRNRYRNAEVLLIDDIQFLGGKEQTQEGLFHIFNELYHNNRQIVVTSDRAPRELQSMSDRLLSRFEWGLIADIQMPVFETRVAILQEKGALLKIGIPDDVTSFLAKRDYDSIRELESSLNRVVAYSELLGQPVTLELTTRALGENEAGRTDRVFAPNDLMALVAWYYGTDVKVLESNRRDQSTVHSRHVCMYLLHEDFNRSYTEIGRLLGGRDHSSVFYACRRIREKLDKEQELTQEIQWIRQRYSPRSSRNQVAKEAGSHRAVIA